MLASVERLMRLAPGFVPIIGQAGQRGSHRRVTTGDIDNIHKQRGIGTGAAHGMGESHARLFAQEGARVVATDRRDKLGEETVASIRTAGGEAIYLSHDVTDERQWQSVIATAVTRYGKIDILVNNAAFAALLQRRGVLARGLASRDGRVCEEHLSGL